MFSGLRLRLTFLYALAALALVALVGGGGYLVVARYFRNATDLALQHKMTHEFHALAAPIPAELASADRDWSIVRAELGLLPRTESGMSSEEAVQRAVTYLGGGTLERVELKQEDDRAVYEVRFTNGAEVTIDRLSGRVLAAERNHSDREESDDPPLPLPTADADYDDGAAFDAELAAIFVLPLDQRGRLLFDPDSASVPLAPDLAALQAALANGSDLRTITTSDQRSVRLLTYRLTRSDGPAALQLGRELSDQQQVLGQLMIGLIALGTLSMTFVGLGSWWLAGRALRPAEEAWERQQRFVASASHELRTPLTLIRASAEVALRGTPAADSDQRELLGDVLAESDHMRRLVDDLLTLSRLDSGRLQLAMAPVDLPVLLADIQRQVDRLGQERGVQVLLGPVDGLVRADPDRLRQVLLTLLDNALRHTPAGGQIWLSAQQHGQAVRLSVRDTGSGIAPEHLPLIFERFYRADPARGRAGGNAGLGLSIARGLINTMGGQISAESTLGQGTTIWIVLPAI